MKDNLFSHVNGLRSLLQSTPYIVHLFAYFNVLLVGYLLKIESYTNKISINKYVLHTTCLKQLFYNIVSKLVNTK